MGTVTCPEIREVTLSPKERAKARDSYVRNFDRQFKDWSEIARCCIEVQRDKDWELLGHHSWDAWLHEAAAASYSYIYLAIDLYKRLSPDISEEELSQIPIGSAKVLREVSPAARRNSKTRAAAKKKPRELRKVLKEEFPDQHVEVTLKIELPSGINDLLEEGREAYEVLKGPIAMPEFLEFLVSNWLDEPWEDSGYSVRQRKTQILGSGVHRVEERSDSDETAVAASAVAH